MPFVYNKGKNEMSSVGSTNWSSSTLVAILLSDAYTYDADHEFISDVVTEEISNVGYSRQTLTNKTKTQSDTRDHVRFSADDPSFGSVQAGDQPKYCVIARNSGADGTSPLICCLEIVAPPVPDGSTYNLLFSSDGILSLED